MRVAIVGAPGTGKSTLAHALRADSTLDIPLDIHDSPPLPDALPAAQPRWDLVLLMGLDLPLTQGATTQHQHTDRQLRTKLRQLAIEHATVYGHGPARTQQALQAVAYASQRPVTPPTQRSRWRWACEKCSDPDCEHRLFRDLAMAPPLKGP